MFFLYSSWLQPPVTEIKLKRENIYVWMQKIIGLRPKMWCYNLMFGKKYFNHVSLLLCIYIYMNLTHTSRDSGWLNWEFDYQILSFFTIGALVAAHWRHVLMLYIPEQENIEVWLQNWTTFWWCINHSM